VNAGTATITTAEALATAGTADVWLFRGPSLADRAIRLATNSPVNHAAMAVALDDLPPLVWHTELGRSLVDVWTGESHRGAQLNLMSEVIPLWRETYGQTPYVRQFDGAVTREMEDALLRTVAEYDGRPFPRARKLAVRWLAGRARHEATREALYCAQLVAITYRHMGLLDGKRPSNWYDPGTFWSGDRLALAGGASLGAEIAVTG
jgi:hypothetical protein